MVRQRNQLYPDFTAELRELEKNGFSLELLYKILQKHKKNSEYNRKLYDRYMAIDGSAPIMKREPRFKEQNPINNKMNHDFMGEIVNFKTGYFAGKPIAYSYSSGEEAEETSGGAAGVDAATKVLTDFITNNNMYGVDMEITKYASIYGYSGRLFYIDKDGLERVMAVHGYETIILSHTSICEPEYAVRYFYTLDMTGNKVWTVEWYDSTTVTIFTGNLSSLEMVEQYPHMFDYCPLQGVANNTEKLGDAEKVLSLIDGYDKGVSDNANEHESSAHSYMVIENINMTPEKVQEAQSSGSFVFRSMGTQEGKIYFLEKNVNDTFTQNHLDRLEDDIYRFSDTPNLNDESFGSASGVSLKFKLHGLETKCGTFQAQIMSAAQYMWKVLTSSWNKRGNTVDRMQITMDFKRNFPLDTLTEAQTVQALIAAGIPKRIAFAILSFIDDVDYVMELIEEEQNAIPGLDDVPMEDAEGVEGSTGGASDEELDEADTGEEKIQLLNGAQIQALTGIIQQVQQGIISRKAAITIAVSSLGISRENAEAMIEEKLS